VPDGSGPGAPDGAPLDLLSGRWLTLAAAGVVLVVVVGVLLRFWTRSALWLDEALTVDIARLPVREIPTYLKRDGAPPLFYVLLHFWMRIFGTSNLATRSLSGVISVATLPVAWVAGRRVGGRTVAWVVLAVLASAPFAVYYATEARMYALVMFLTACGFVAVSRALERPRPGNVIALAVVVAAILYTQYWGIYLVGALGLWLLWQLWRGHPEWRSGARWLLASLVAGVAAFAPWVPTFLYQSAHTGTPWATPPNYAAVINAVTGFTDNQGTTSVAGSNQGRLLALCYFVLLGLALFGLASDRRHVEIDIRTRPPMRGITFVIMMTLVAAITGAIISGSAFSSRYAAVIFFPLLVVIAYGTRTLADARIRVALVAVMVVAGLASSVENIWTLRTQAPQVVQVLSARAHQGDIVVFCPDQLGPAVYRFYASGQDTAEGPYGQFGRFRMITYPRGIGPAFVDWVTYVKVAEASNPASFAGRLEHLAGSSHEIWLVSAPGYTGYANKCGTLASDLQHAPGYGARNWVYTNAAKYYEPMSLVEFKPPGYVAPTGRP
jgi:4-amino-4-deoxy-L-arabinose transferase-like glycosyltransferase